MARYQCSMNRRSFLLAGSSLAVATSMASSSTLAAKADQRPDAALDAHVQDTLLSVAKRLYPHPNLHEELYRGVVRALDADAAESEELAETLASGVRRLDSRLGVAFIDLSTGYQDQVLAQMADDSMVQKVRSKEVVALYDQKLVWRFLGYEGESFPDGYVNRGFDDLSWLPEPPASASPPAPYT